MLLLATNQALIVYKVCFRNILFPILAMQRYSIGDRWKRCAFLAYEQGVSLARIKIHQLLLKSLSCASNTDDLMEDGYWQFRLKHPPKESS